MGGASVGGPTPTRRSHATVGRGVHALKQRRVAAVKAPITPANIIASINSIPMLNGTNFKSWQENLPIVLGVMDLDLALRIDSPTPLNDQSTPRSKEGYGKVGEIKSHVYDDHEESHSRSIPEHNV
ncbi:hypothetical protein NL676_029905 [Syzygium grande]|nr:hypothetical protein NL676_029905 [Syzygium grande]